MNAINCLCQKGSKINEESAWEDIWEELKNLHNKCSAVKFLIPGFESWFKDNKEPEETAFHQSTLVLAFRRGHLDRITSPIHSYILSKQTAGKDKNAIIEKWWKDGDSLERHEKSRIWMGRMAELKVAEWLEENGWKIEGMEAWGDKCDIKAKSPDNKEVLIEVKYIGQENDEFKAIVESLKRRVGMFNCLRRAWEWLRSNSIAKGVCVTTLNPYVAFNYVLYRIFEAAYQLKKNMDGANIQKEVALVICSSTWNTMKMPLKWMRDNNGYRFHEEEVELDINWRNFYSNTIMSQKNKNKYGGDLFNMHNLIKRVNRITVFKMTDWLLEQKMNWSPPATLIPG